MKYIKAFTLLSLLGMHLIGSYATSQSAQTTSQWVGEFALGDASHFVRIEPQLMGDDTLYYSQPNDWLFNQDITDLVLDDDTMRFSSVGMVFEGTAEDGLVTGTVTREDEVGSFTLYPVTEMDGSSFEAYIGNYQLPNRTLLVSFQEALGMRHLFYGEGNNFVRLYPVAEDVFFTPLGETITFFETVGDVTGLELRTSETRQEAKKVFPYREETFSLALADATIEGTLLLPNGAGTHPGIILGQGSGQGERNYWRLYADRFAKDGFVTLIFDRRGTGKSTGDDGGLNAFLLAEDVKVLYGYLQARAEVDSARVGLWGFSNATWVMPLAAKVLPDVAFVAVTGASAVSQVDAEIYRRSKAFADEGISEVSSAQLLRVWELIYQQAVFNIWNDAWTDEFASLLDSVKANEELKVLPAYEFPPPVPLEQFLGEFGGLLSYMGYVPAETYASLNAPVLFIVGELDENTAPQASIAAMQDVIAARPEADITLEVLPNTGHSLYILPDTFTDTSFDAGFKIATNAYTFTDGYMATLRRWLKEKAGL